MIKKPFFGLRKPKLKYPVEDTIKLDSINEIPLPLRVTLLSDNNERSDDVDLKVGDKVKTGQILGLSEKDGDYLISTVTGTISEISQYTGYFGKTCASISINAETEDQWDEEFIKAVKAPASKNCVKFLRRLPGAPSFSSVLSNESSVKTIIINGIDKDLLTTTNQLIVKTGVESLTEGVRYLKQITNTDRIIIIVPPDLTYQAEKTGAEVKVVKPLYPNTLPHIQMKNIIFTQVFCYSKPYMPEFEFILPTRVSDIETIHGDRLIMGGPMTGNAIYSDEMPVLPDTDAIMVQDKDQIIQGSDTHCINCGECIRVCPAKIPVNMLIRLLENDMFEEAAEEYDLLSCVECGLCSYVCMARIPILHYIMLGKHELSQLKMLEESSE
ncbi:MAG: hypothetical protein B1H11_05770 [Desulfobacteraceae bacterium 4484_190.1]|nr:MAG: hypothetical protein B1H11_05770 [Desulfobacteraceae bacterium 4484_190.1]